MDALADEPAVTTTRGLTKVPASTNGEDVSKDHLNILKSQLMLSQLERYDCMMEFKREKKRWH
jgi:hypothetical protein